MIGTPELNIWYHTKNSLYPLYEQRAKGLVGELDCHGQAAQIYAPHHLGSDRILDAGGGSGYFYHSLAQRRLLGSYHLLDQNQDFVNIGRKYLPANLPQEAFIHGSLEEISGSFEAVFCLNTLFALPDYRQALERLLVACCKVIVLRTTLSDKTEIRYETDDYLDPTGYGLKSYFNIWSIAEVSQFMAGYGFEVEEVTDLRTGGSGEISAGKHFPWRWLVATRAVALDPLKDRKGRE